MGEVVERDQGAHEFETGIGDGPSSMQAFTSMELEDGGLGSSAS